jgi:NADPH:quinone reductase-like Zn-dependent oxidoreductase
MKAIVRETYRRPDVLHLEEVPVPTLGDGDVLVRVHAASANAGDWHLLRGTPFPFRLVAGVRTPKFKIIGTPEHSSSRATRSCRGPREGEEAAGGPPLVKAEHRHAKTSQRMGDTRGTGINRAGSLAARAWAEPD